MSMPFTIIQCSHCNEKWYSGVAWGYFLYKLPNGEEVFIDRELGWCYDCNAICPIEILPTQESLIKDYYEALKKAQEHTTSKKREDRTYIQSMFFIRKKRPLPTQNFLREEENKLIWKGLRTDPPRCLTCGGTNHHVFDSHFWNDDEILTNFNHPQCGHLLTKEESEIRISVANTKKYYTHQGIKIDIG